jgi:RsiW-degrading membrane proteinase PrsW (M82 family)
MSELLITVGGGQYRYGPGIVRIGRSSENDIVISDPTVSRRHAQISWEADGWTWQNLGQAPTFLGGQPVARFVVANVVDVSLASPHGPTIRLQLVPDAAQPGAAPVRADLGAGALPAAAASPWRPAPPAAGPPSPAAAAASPAAAAPAGPPSPAAPAGPQPPAATPVGAPSPAAAPVGAPSPAAAPRSPAAGPSGHPAAPLTAAAGAGLAGGPLGAVAPPGMPGYPGFGAVPGVPQLDVTKLERGSFFETLVPLKSWLHDKGWRQGLRLLIIPYALLPLLFLQVFASATSLGTPGWAYSIYVAPLWLIAFWYLIRPPSWGRIEVWIAVGVVIWEYVWLHAVTINVNDAFVKVTPTHPLTFPEALIVGFNEETSKAIPVLVAAALLLTVRKQKLDPRTWMIMGTIAGLTFGVIEQSIYTPQALNIVATAHNNISQADFGALDFAFRVFVDGFQHAVWAGISGFFVGMAINYRRRRIPILLLGICIPAVLHALNDWTLTIFNTVWVTVFLVQGVSLLLFLGYTLSASDIERRVRRNPAFRGQSIMMERFSQP